MVVVASRAKSPAVYGKKPESTTIHCCVAGAPLDSERDSRITVIGMSGQWSQSIFRARKPSARCRGE